MLIIRHRVNKIEDLKKTPQEYGVEIDIRAYGDRLLLNHDSIKNPDDHDELEDYLKEYKHAFIIFNIKEAGIEKQVIGLAKKYDIEDYFLLDVEFPFLYYATRRDGFKKIAVRFSEAEPIEMALAQKGLLDWVWIDVNTQLPLTREVYDRLKKEGFKLCLVCPERWGRPQDIKIYRKFLDEERIDVDAVMTSMDYIKDWS
ncbi:MAG: hypothetical protein Q8N99_06470 [Nanoarchaeota archaeon]|nr:hypothetical protein [Nanoarchaeota archaeon]